MSALSFRLAVLSCFCFSLLCGSWPILLLICEQPLKSCLLLASFVRSGLDRFGLARLWLGLRLLVLLDAGVFGTFELQTAAYCVRVVGRRHLLSERGIEAGG